MKYYFFRDKDDAGNLKDGKTYHAAGYVDKIYCDINKPRPSGKDIAVSFFKPFEGVTTRAWRSLDEVELFEVDEWEYKYLVESYSAIQF